MDLIDHPVLRKGNSRQWMEIHLRQFAFDFLNVVKVPISFWDERLSTSAVNRILISEADMSRKKRNKIVDKMAAAYILQGALDFLNQNK